ncbi:MAG: hypothetical protein WBB45_20605 [Cyclobacteriaceae bacterium]
MPFIDLHCHPSLKPYQNNKAGKSFDIYEHIPDASDKKVIKEFKGDLRKMLLQVERRSQSNIETLADNDFKLVFAAIHPIERGWFEFRISKLVKKLLKLLAGITDSNKRRLASVFTGIDEKRVTTFFDEIENGRSINYFDEAIEEYELISKQQDTGTDYGYRIVPDFDAYQTYAPGHKGTALILSIEGGHCLFNFDSYDDTTRLNNDLLAKYRPQVLENIQKCKGLQPGGFDKEHTPFFITLAHFYNNLLVGHAQSYFGAAKLVFKQKKGLNNGFTSLGKEAMALLLKRGPDERRILLDVKHMSYTARQQYYAFISGLRRAGDNIPVVFSHGAVNGYSAKVFRDQGKDEPITQGYFSHASINLFDEDLDAIIDSDGIIGLSPHEGRMPGKHFHEGTKDLKRTIGFDDHRRQRAEDRLRLEYVKLFLANILHIVHYKGEKAWNHICLGTDFDGIMDPFDTYSLSIDVPRLVLDMKNLLRRPQTIRIYKNNDIFDLEPRDVKKLLFGKTPDELIDKIAYKNLERFMSKYFTDRYRMGQSAGPVIA